MASRVLFAASILSDCSVEEAKVGFGTVGGTSSSVTEEMGGVAASSKLIDDDDEEACLQVGGTFCTVTGGAGDDEAVGGLSGFGIGG